MAYDFRNRLVSTIFTNADDPGLAYQPLSIINQYDLDDNLTQSIETKTGPSVADITEEYVYDYDALDKLTETTRHDDLERQRRRRDLHRRHFYDRAGEPDERERPRRQPAAAVEPVAAVEPAGALLRSRRPTTTIPRTASGRSTRPRA